MSRVYRRSFVLEGRAGRLEALLWTAPVSPPHGPAAALVCHPHPLHGGTMHNKVVYRATRALYTLGFPVLRFNFRGAGLSEGAFNNGRGECDDVRAALDFLAGEFPGQSLLLAGFSFGAWVGLRVGCADPRVSHLVGLGLPANDSDLAYLRQCGKPKLFIQGALDQFGSLENVQALVGSLPEPKWLVVVEGADHFFTGKLDLLEAALRAWVERQ